MPPPFHDNKLKAVGLDESGDDPTYSPPRHSAKTRKAPRYKPEATPNATSSFSQPIVDMGSCLSKCRGKRSKRTTNDVVHIYEDDQPYGNRSRDSGIDGYPLESLRGQSTYSNAATQDTASLNTGYGSSFNDQVDWGNQADLGVQRLGDQNRFHASDYDMDSRMTIGAHLPGSYFNNTDHVRPGTPSYGTGASTNFANSNVASFHRPAEYNQSAYQQVNVGNGYEVNQFAGHTVGHGNGGQETDEPDVSTSSRGRFVNDGVSKRSTGKVRATKVPKVNKDGAPRKPRQTRPKLLKWTDDDWKNAVLGLVWACGEVGLPIPFDQAAQLVGVNCTAGALQQALLKLRDKQLAEGHQIPLLKMAWTRKNKRSASTMFNADVNSEQDFKQTKTWQPKKTATHQEQIQVYFITLQRAYVEDDRRHLPSPYQFTNDLDDVRPGNDLAAYTDPHVGGTFQAGQSNSLLLQAGPMSGVLSKVDTLEAGPSNAMLLQAGTLQAGPVSSVLFQAGPSSQDIALFSQHEGISGLPDLGESFDTFPDLEADGEDDHAQLDEFKGVRRNHYAFEENVSDNYWHQPSTPPRSAAAAGMVADYLTNGTLNPQGQSSYGTYFDNAGPSTVFSGQVGYIEDDDVFG